MYNGATMISEDNAIDDKALRILLVEDHGIVQRATYIMLKSAGCIVDQVDSGSKALEYFQKKNYHLILMDIGLPDISGLTIAATMRSSNDQVKANTPIVIVTAHSDKMHRERAKEVGVADFIIKPFTVDVRDKLIKKYLNFEVEDYDNQSKSR